jgi:hypothetical protein
LIQFCSLNHKLYPGCDKVHRVDAISASQPLLECRQSAIDGLINGLPGLQVASPPALNPSVKMTAEMTANH